jgi:hypothetical protein
VAGFFILLLVAAVVAVPAPTLCSTPSDSAVEAGGSTTAAGRPSRLFNVLDFGATPNDDSDDSSAITAADDAAGSSLGVVYFPPGTYIVGSSLRPKSNRIWTGPGVIRRKSATNIPLLAADGVSNFTLDGLTLDGAKARQQPLSPSTAPGNQFSNCSHLTIRNVTITGFGRYPLRVTNGKHVLVTASRFDGGEGASGVSSDMLLFDTTASTDDVRVIGNVFDRVEDSWWSVVQFRGSGAGTKTATHLVFTGNRVSMPFKVRSINALAVEFGVGASYFSATGNVISGGAMAISLSQVDSGSVTGNHLEVGDAENAVAFGADHKGIEVTGSNDISITANSITGKGFLVSGVRVNRANARVVVSGNTIGRLGEHASSWGIEYSNSTDGVISANVIDGNGAAPTGISATNAAGLVIDANVIGNLRGAPASSAIRVFGVSSIMMSDNQIRSSSEYAIRVNGSSQFTVHGNQIRDAPTWGIYIEGGKATVNGTVSANVISAPCASAAILIKDVPGVIVSGNVLEVTGATGYPISLQAASRGMEKVIVRDNVMHGGREPSVLATGVAGGPFEGASSIEWSSPSRPLGGPCTVGMRVSNAKLAELGSPGTRYVVSGWRCTATGNPGTWAEERVRLDR